MKVLPTKPDNKKPQIIIVTKDYSGFGFAKMSVEAGYPTLMATAFEPDDDASPKKKKEEAKAYELVGKGVVDKITLKELMTSTNKYRDAYIIWDGNHNWKESEQLRKMGYKVFGGTELMYKMEKDRKFGTDMVKKAGIATPPTFEFKNIPDGLEFLDKNPDKAYVFKPDDSAHSYSTYPPDAEINHMANEELYRYMESLPDDGTSYILQERIKGVETNFEVWLYQGKPFFAFACLESKRKLNKDEGELVGCAHDVAFTIPIDCKAIERTVGKLIPLMKDYTGFLDVNVIVAERDCYFLEFCARFGYNSHPNLFKTLAIDKFPEIMTDFMDGKVSNFYEHFRFGFGASISLYIDHPQTGFPLEIPDEIDSCLYHFDTYHENDKYFLAGFGNEVGIVTAHDFDLKSAAAEAIRYGDKITYPMHAMRTDIDKEDYNSSLYKRWVALVAMRFFEKPPNF